MRAALDIARQGIDELRRGEYEGGVWHPDVEVVNAAGWVIETSYRGHDGLRRWWADLAEAFHEFDVELDEIFEVDDERVLTTQRFLGRFRATDLPFDGPWASIFWIEGGMIVRAEGFLTKQRALRAAGLLD